MKATNKGKAGIEMCCSAYGVSEDEVNGVCPACNQPVYVGVRQEFSEALDEWIEVPRFLSSEICSYSPTICEVCEHAPCDESC